MCCISVYNKALLTRGWGGCKYFQPCVTECVSQPGPVELSGYNELSRLAAPCCCVCGCLWENSVWSCQPSLSRWSRKELCPVLCTSLFLLTLVHWQQGYTASCPRGKAVGYPGRDGYTRQRFYWRGRFIGVRIWKHTPFCSNLVLWHEY